MRPASWRTDWASNTVRHWQREGLAALADGRPVLFHGVAVREFLQKRNAGRKRPCPPRTLYCFHCREPRPPALGMVDYVELRPGTGNLRALCAACEGVIHRRANRAALAAVMPGVDVQIAQASPSLVGKPAPSLYCNLKRYGST